MHPIARPLLQVAIAGVMAFGLVLVFLPDLTCQGFSLLVRGDPHWLATQLPAEALAYVQLAHGVLGAVMFGWGLTLWLVQHGQDGLDARQRWQALALPLTAWYVLDTGFSLATGFWQNAVLNTVFAVAFAIPLILIRPSHLPGHK